MAIFSVNQVNHLYVANAYKATVADTDAVGTISSAQMNSKEYLYFSYKSPGGLVRSDLIPQKNILSVKAVDADSLATSLSKYKLVLDSTINTGAPVGGQEYILKIQFRNYIGLSEQDQNYKFGMVHATSGMTASNFYKAMILSLVKNFSKEEGGLLSFYLETGGTVPGTVAGTPVEVTKYTKESTLTGTYTGIVIEEKPQEWILGVFTQLPVNYTVFPQTITVDGDERFWGICTKVASTKKLDNGKKIADLEYFLMGERGDQYRMVGFPKVIRTKYLVDPDVKYNMISIHYAYTGDNESVQKSEKDITIVVPKIGANNSLSNKLTNDIITKINADTSLAIPLLSVSTT